jgi:ATP-dependent DNA helicase RecG
MMIDDLLKGTENRETEFKEKQNSALFKTLSAFANTNGGVVLIGISDAKKVVGCRCSNADLKELTDTIVNKLCTIL